MKSFKLLMVLAFFISANACNAQSTKTETKAVSTDKIEAYYFHFSTRCITCKAVESEAKADIESLYGGKISFQAVNLDDASSKTLSEKLQISGQTLLIVKGNTKINLTNEGFMYARTNPEKFKSVIKEKIDGLINVKI
jgi:hypothetical protein